VDMFVFIAHDETIVRLQKKS